MADTSQDLQDCFQAQQMFSSNATVQSGNWSGNWSGGNVSCDIDFYGQLMSANPADSAEFEALKEPVYALLIIISYVIVIFLGAVGNTLVVITVLKTRQLWNATNVFISNLAVTDVFVCLFVLPLSIYYQITDFWIFGKALCHVIPAAYAVVTYASTLTLALIAVDRFLLIVYPLNNRMSVMVALILVVVIALSSVAVASPIAIFAKYFVYDDPSLNIHRRYCWEKWPTKGQRQLYTVLTLVMQYFMPLAVIAILYSLIFRQIKTRMRKASRKTKTTKMMVAVVTVFALSWTPFHLFALISEFNVDLVRGRYYKLIDALLKMLAMSSSCLNPLLYGWLNDNYRNAFLSIIQKPTAPRRGIYTEESATSHRGANLITSLRRASTLYKQSFLSKVRKGDRVGEKCRKGGSEKGRAGSESPAACSQRSMESRALVMGSESPAQSPKIVGYVTAVPEANSNVGPSVESPLLTHV